MPQVQVGPERRHLRFSVAVRRHFAFLSRLGFAEAEADATHLRFTRGMQFVEVFHGRSSYEVGAKFGRWEEVEEGVVEDAFHVFELVSLLPEEDRSVFVARSATTAEQVDRFVAELAGWSERVLPMVEADVEGVFQRMRERRERRSTEYLDAMRAERLRKQADGAWRNGDLAAVLLAYEEIASELATVELKQSEAGRMRYARSHLASGD